MAGAKGSPCCAPRQAVASAAGTLRGLSSVVAVSEGLLGVCDPPTPLEVTELNLSEAVEQPWLYCMGGHNVLRPHTAQSLRDRTLVSH